MTALSLAAVIVLSGCSQANQQPQTSNQTEATASQVPAKPAFPTLGVVNDGSGEYLQTTVADDDPALAWQPEKFVRAEINAMPKDRVLAAQKTAVKFIAEEGIDATMNAVHERLGQPEGTTTLNPAASQVWAEWLSRNQSKYASNYKLDLQDPWKHTNRGTGSGTVGPGVLFGGDRQFVKSGPQFSYVYGADKTRLLDRKFDIKAISGDNNGVQMLLEVDFNLAATYAGKPVIERGSQTYTIEMVEEAGVWKFARISGH